jgi:hypothetical protein
MWVVVMAQYNPANRSHQPRPPEGFQPLRQRARPRRAAPPKKKRSNLVIWEWAIVLLLIGGLAATFLFISSAPDPQRQATDLVVQMKAAALGRPLGAKVFDNYPTVQRNKQVAVVSIDKIPPKVCVLVSWDLYHFGFITVNGSTPSRVTAAKLVELCNENETATLTWTARLIN